MVPSTDVTIRFDAFADEHENLERNLTDLRELLTQRQDSRAAIDTLAELSEHVLAHFVHEEQEDGFFDNVVEEAPRLKSRAEVLIREHATMTEALTQMQLCASCGARSEQWWRELNARFETFWEVFCHHERAEIDLVQQAFNDDIGPGD